MSVRHQLTVEYIDSPQCGWPSTVKAQGKRIIQLTAELNARKHKLSQVSMDDPEKIHLLAEIASHYQQLANAYRNMSKELVYHLAHHHN